MSNLFLDQDFHLEFEKIASPAKLSDTPENWQKEVASEVLKQCPYLADYMVNIIVERVDPERGYAFGSAEIGNKTDAPEPDQPSAKIRVPIIIKNRTLQPLDVFIADDEAYPLTEARIGEHLFRSDTFETSDRKPTDQGMTDQLFPPLRSHGFGNTEGTGTGLSGFGKQAGNIYAHPTKPNTFVHVSDQGAKSEIGQGHPMYSMVSGARQRQQTSGFGKQASLISALREPIVELRYEAQTAPSKEARQHAKHQLQEYKHLLQKLGSVQGEKALAMGNKLLGSMKKSPLMSKHLPIPKVASLIEAIAPTVSEQELDRFVNQILDDEELSIAVARNPIMEKLAMALITSPRVSVEKTAEALIMSIKPTVVQLTKLANGNFKVKWANADNFAPQEGEVGPDQAASMAGSDKVTSMDPDQPITVSTEKGQKTSLSEEKIEQVSEFGQFRVRNEDSGEDMEGVCIPIMDFEMQPLELFVWTDGNTYSVQDEIAGVRIGHDLNLPSGEPSGDGTFYIVDEQAHRARAFLPMTINNAAEDETGMPSHMGETVFGEEITITKAPGLQAVQELSPGHYAIPEEALWLPLGQPIHLVKSPTDMDSIEEGREAPGAVDVSSTGEDDFSVEGEPVEKLAYEHKTFIGRNDTEFLLVAMGADPFYVREKLAHATKFGKAKLAGLNSLTPLSHRHEEMTKKAAKFLADFPYELRRNLIKEAAALDDAEAADKILSLNFLSPENLSIFASYLPTMDEAAKKLAEMLIAARLGMTQIPEGAIERGMKNLEAVIQGLKVLQQKETA